MESLTLILHKAKDTKNKVVYGTKDGSVIQSVYIDKDAPWATLRRPLSKLSSPSSRLGASLLRYSLHKEPASMLGAPEAPPCCNLEVRILHRRRERKRHCLFRFRRAKIQCAS